MTREVKEGKKTDIFWISDTNVTVIEQQPWTASGFGQWLLFEVFRLS